MRMQYPNVPYFDMLTAMARSNSASYFFPSETGTRIFHQILFAPSQLGKLPAVDRDVFGPAREIIPKIFDELKFFGRAEVEHGFWFGRHGIGLGSRNQPFKEIGVGLFEFNRNRRRFPAQLPRTSRLTRASSVLTKSMLRNGSNETRCQRTLPWGSIKKVPCNGWFSKSSNA